MSYDWDAVADRVWVGETIEQACKYLGYDEAEVRKAMEDMKQGHDWDAVADRMWLGETIQQACKYLGYDEMEVIKVMTQSQRGFMLDTSMMANARYDALWGDGDED